MKFTTPCFVRVEDAEKRKKLIYNIQKLGYDIWRCDEPTIYCFNNIVCGIATSHPKCSLKEFIDCGDNIELFKALAAMNDEIFCSTPCCGAWALIDEEYENRISKR